MDIYGLHGYFKTDTGPSVQGVISQALPGCRIRYINLYISFVLDSIFRTTVRKSFSVE